MRMWIANALLASSWLLGLGYFDPANQIAWACTLLAAVILLSDTPMRLPGFRQRVIAVLLLSPAVWFVPFPCKGIPALLLAGIAASLAPIPSSWWRRFSRGAVIAGAVLVPQSLVLLAYQIKTARAHELPTMLSELLAASARLLGAEATIDSATLVLRNASTTVRLAATWELLFAPGTVCFVAGGVALLTLLAYNGRRHPASAKRLLRGTLILLLLCLVWAYARAVSLAMLVLQQQLRATVVTDPNVGEILVSTWVHIGLLLAFALLVGLLVPLHHARRQTGSTTARHSSQPVNSRWRQGSAMGCCFLAVVILTSLYFWVPVGQRKEGRVMFVERHSTWEPTTEPYGTEVYGEAGSYNYAAIYAYCSQFYDMARLLDDQRLDDAALSQCDILIIKTPTSRYQDEEVQAVVRFVERGGSLLMIGDHTNVFNMNTYLNDVSRHFGFTFRNDLLFRIGHPYRQAYRPPRIGHPILQHVPPMNFAVSCSIDPGSNRGTMVIRNSGLFNLPPAYHESNYHPQAEYRPYMQYGAWCQLWSTVHGQGRVVAFADSTLFSNFCTFQPGKSELFVGMLEWLNHASRWDSPTAKRVLTIPLMVAGVLSLILGVWLSRGLRGGWFMLIASGAAAYAAGGWLVVQVHQHAMPFPPKHHSMMHVVIDRTVSSVPLFTGAFADDPEGAGYGMLEQWIPRVGNYISRRSGTDALVGDAVVIICPTRLPSQRYRDELIEWVRNGGQLVVFDTPDVVNSTANSILMLFGLSSVRNAPKPATEDEPLRLADDSAQTPLLMSCEIQGGEPVAVWGGVPVAARVEFGQGAVTAIGFGSLFNDANMGYHWLAEPDADLLQRYDVLYGLLRAGLRP